MEKQIGKTTALVTISASGIIQSVDAGCGRIFGYGAEELVKQNVKILMPDPFAQQHDSYIQRYQTTKKKRIIGKSRIVSGKRKDGSVFPLRLTVQEVIAGPMVIYVGLIEQLESDEVRIQVDSQSTISGVTGNTENLWGYSHNDLIGKNINVIVPPPHSARHDDYISEYIKTRTSKVIGHVRNSGSVAKDGSIVTVSLRVSDLGNGTFEARVDKIQEELEAVFTLDLNGIVKSCTQFTFPLFGYQPDELEGKEFMELVPSATFDISHSSTENCEGLKKAKISPSEFDEEKLCKGDSQLFFSSSTDECLSEAIGNVINQCSTDDSDNTDVVEDSNNSGEKRKRNDSSSSSKVQHIIQVPSERKGTQLTKALHKDGSWCSVLLHMETFNCSDGGLMVIARVKRVIEGACLKAAAKIADCGEQKKIEEYVLSTLLGKGTYGSVRLGTHSKNGHLVAVKILHKDLLDEAELNRVRREIAIMEQLDHENICKLFKVVETVDRMYLIMELCGGGELFNYVSTRGRLSEEESRRLFKQIVSGVDYCHQKGIVHRDIKHKNILLDDTNCIKLIDFGLSNYLTPGELRSTFCGTPAYSAPEMILAQKYHGPEVDIWSMGVVLYAMLTGQFPFSTVKDIISASFTDPPNVSSECALILREMLKLDPTQRITIEQIYTHPWMTVDLSPKP